MRKEFIKNFITLIASEPSRVSVLEDTNKEGQAFLIQVYKNDLSKVFGKNSMTLNALKNILAKGNKDEVYIRVRAVD